MLQSLTIKNFGLIDEINLEFHEALNVLTGQTGAGKSILLEGLRVALGGRFTAAQVRQIDKPSLVEAVFDLTAMELREHPEIADFLLEEDAQLIIQRTFDNKTKSRIKINGMSVSATQLKTVGSLLLDFHGPHDHQMLLSASSHLKMLDRLIDFQTLKEDYKKEFAVYEDLSRQQKELDHMRQTRERELDLITHQVRELEELPLEEEAYQSVLSEQIKVNNAEKLHRCIQQIASLLDEDAGSCLEQIRKIFTPMRHLTAIDSQTEPFLDLCTQFQAIGDELALQIRGYADGLAFDERNVDEVHRQADLYQDLLRKYGTDLSEVKKFYVKTKARHDMLIHFETNQEDVQHKLALQEKKIRQSAQALTDKRRKAALALQKVIEKELAQLGIEHVRFEVRFEKEAFSAEGQDRVLFYISPNAGEDLKPLSEIVSSGEAARVMLALKKALIKVDPVPVLVFDEIDAQIGGRLGKITGEKLRDISRFRQVLLITHLPQIASFANHHYKVRKRLKNKRATTEVLLLDEDARIDELAQMMSGSKGSDISLRHAEDMLAQAAH